MDFDNSINLKITWDILIEQISENRMFSESEIRTTEGLSEYKEYNKSIEAMGISIDDYLFENFFAKNNPEYVFTSNRFPYNFEKDIAHYLLWVNPKLKQQSVEPYNLELRIKKELKKRNIKYKEFLCHQNLYCEQSVKTIKHIHIFVKLDS